jgi:hypothetical protein
MAGRDSRRGNSKDSRVDAARYAVDRLVPEGEATEPEKDVAGQSTMDARAQYVEISIQQAMRRGDFDDLPGAGKPLEGLNGIHDPDWWIRRKIEREKLTGLGPPALTLRTESAELNDRLDRLASERQVREILEDFNKRIVEARRQLLGGPPVVTPVRDIPAEVERWRERREAARLVRETERERAEAQTAAMTWRERRRARRDGTIP